ncbi:AraC family transcriptional regulator [Wukongibacter sp. M2B1]|uniref:AraC family transcriptional regulator n=1 Tax=Wukongibacter sp. M2B1 TaxID=3088895 RepID=UPI003D7AE128
MNGIKCERRIYTDKLNTHSHDFAQLILPLSGNLHIQTDYEKLLLDDEHLFFLPPSCKHTFKADKNNEFLVLDIPFHMANRKDMSSIKGGNSLVLDDRWKAIRFLLLNEATNEKNSNSINNLFHYFYSFIEENNLPDSVKYINEHFAEDIELKTLADIEHYSRSYYSEWFKRNMKISTKEYIQKLRIEEAKRLLLNTDFTILRVSQMVGYNHNSSLTRVFKDIEKVTPDEYRRKMKK